MAGEGRSNEGIGRRLLKCSYFCIKAITLFFAFLTVG